MTPDTLRTVGRALYGARWQTELSLALCVNVRTVRAWLSGRYIIPASLRLECAALAERRRAEIDEALRVLRMETIVDRPAAMRR